MDLVPTIDPHEYSKIPGGNLVSDKVALFFENAPLKAYHTQLFALNLQHRGTST